MCPSILIAKEDEKDTSAMQKGKVLSESERTWWCRTPSPSSQTKTGTQLAQCVLRLKDLPAMSSCARAVHRRLTNLPLWISSASRKQQKRASGCPLMIYPLTSFPVDWRGSCGVSRATCPFSLPRSTHAVRSPQLTTHWKDLAADQSIAVVINSDADCFPLMRWGEQQAGQ